MREQSRWNEHATFMDGLAEERFILAGGPVGEGRQEGALHIVRADSPGTVRSSQSVTPSHSPRVEFCRETERLDFLCESLLEWLVQ
jgi:hypothetical protein